VYKQGKRHFATHMTVFYLRREGEPGAGNLRIGFTVGKALGGAVQRNRMKRRLREAVRLTGLTPDYAVDIVINPKRSLLSAEFSAVQAEVGAALRAIEKSLGKSRRS
jgi:ribonuclease P protein component